MYVCMYATENVRGQGLWQGLLSGQAQSLGQNFLPMTTTMTLRMNANKTQLVWLGTRVTSFLTAGQHSGSGYVSSLPS